MAGRIAQHDGRDGWRRSRSQAGDRRSLPLRGFHEVRLVFSHGCDDLLGLHGLAQINYLEAVALRHHDHEVLADVVQVVFDRADDDLAAWLSASERQPGLEEGQHALHGARR